MDALTGMFEVMNNTQSLFNSGKRERRRTAVVWIKLEVGGAHRNQAFDLGPQPHHTTTAECRMVGHRDQREGPATQGVPGIDDGDGLFRYFAVTYRGSDLVAVCQCLSGQ